jgi:hypothetical protein
MHLHCRVPDRQNFACGFIHSNDRRLINNNSIFMDDQGICSTQIDRYIARQKIKQSHI